LIQSTVDSGKILYIVLDSTATTDTIIRWTIKQHEELFHQRGGLSRHSDTSYWSNYDSTVILDEKIIGKHEILCSSLIWSFPLTRPSQSVYRYADSARITVVGEDDVFYYPPDFGRYTLLFNSTNGLYMRTYTSQFDHNTHVYYSLTVNLSSTSTGVDRQFAVDRSVVHFQLYQNYPNPFNPSTRINYYLPYYSPVRLSICNSLGQQVQELINECQSAGFHQLTFYGSNLSSGVYYYRLMAGEQAITRNLIYIK